MAETLYTDKSQPKKTRYRELLPQLEALITGEDNLIANLANITSGLYFGMDFFWVGFYRVENEQLVLGPFHGPIACTRIAYGKGVCGTVWQQAKTLIVPNVEEFPGHIACSSDSKSEIVVPGFKNENVSLVLDIDSNKLNDFDTTDQIYLEKLMRIIESKL